MKFSQVEKTCVTCGRKFMVHKCRADIAIACSLKCRPIKLKHGLADTRLYNIHKYMKQRCENPKHRNFNHYGGRGITVCPEWQGVEAFAQWAVANGYAENLELDRIDSDGGYCPENCRWATRTEQNRNTRKKRPGKATSQYKGVWRPRGAKKWHVAIRLNGKKTYVGFFEREIDAAEAYDAAAKVAFGQFAHLNFPNGRQHVACL